jgi:hypothetical protein
VRAAYVMIGAFQAPRSSLAQSAARGSICAATRCVVVVSRECRGAKIDYFPKTRKKLLHNVMQYSAETLAQNYGTKLTSWRNKFNLTNCDATIIMLAWAAIQTNAVRLNTIIASEIK